MTNAVMWAPVLGYEGLYSVSSLGDVRSDARIVKHHRGGPKRLKEKLRKQVESRHGYMTLVLSKEGVNTRHSVHRLVLLAFVGQPPTRMDACHNNGIKTDNRLDNLRWDTREGNMQDTLAHGTRYRGDLVVTRKLGEQDVLKIRTDKRSQSKIAADFGVTQSTVSFIKNKKRWASV